MTSRPPLGVQQRQPPRKLSGPNLSQRPAARQRTYLPPSPIRKETTFHDFSPTDTSDGTQSRYGAPPPARRAGSRLKLELSHDPADTITHVGISESPNTIDSSKPFTPSRIMPPTDSSELGDMSPHLSTRALTVDSDAPLPMPVRRQRVTVDPPRRDVPASAANPVKKDTRPKPYAIEVPPTAPKYYIHSKPDFYSKPSIGNPALVLGPAQAVGYADFFPWSGSHPEDQFSENAIRQGFFDKAPIAQTETSSAKGILFPALKHKSGLVALSSVFTNIIGERRHTGQITAPSTFKPPPRVTLTDTKREMWLKDLANPAISLRRLSRTIPHGIRGRSLLDQCLNKNVPTDRAVWLAKCVGINEIRTFKRKGAGSSLVIGGGEAKFHKEWTLIVEQFVESIIFGFEEPDWKAKVGYAIRLATHLYAEHLLDREHYMEWLVHSFENSEQPKLPMWMLLTEIYWKDLLRLRKYGRRLVTTLVRHHHEIQNHPDKDILLPLFSKLTNLLNTLILSCPENFVFPSVWAKYRDTLKTCLPLGDQVRQNAFMAINHRNEQLVASAHRSQPAARHILVRTLDGTLQLPMPDELPAQCWGISKDKAALVKALLEWCTSLYRPGLAKIFVSSRILQHWSKLGLDATMAVLDFLDGDTFEEQRRQDALFHLVCELVRAGVFSVSRYIQWLMARGSLTNLQDLLLGGPGASRLLVELPTHALAESQKRIRGGMLRRASFSVLDEARDADMAIKYLKRTLGLPMEMDDPILQRKPVSIKKLSKQIAASSRSLKAQVGSWLRDGIAAGTEHKDSEGSQGPELSPAMFNAVRTVLEAAEDFSMLAEILKSLTKQTNVETLAAIADTVSRHFFIFSALGVSKKMFGSLHKRLQVLGREQENGVRPLLASLVCLASRIPGLEELATQLQTELARVDRHNPVDACSPVSDSMLLLQDDDVNLHEEIEKNLASGTSLDRNTMDRLFQTIIERLQSCWGKADDNQRAYSRLLTRLRIFDTQHFDSIMTKWLCYLRTNPNRPSILKIYPLLVSVGCLSIPTILATTSELVGGGPSANMSRPPAPNAPNATGPQVVQITYRTRYMQEALQLFITPVSQDSLLAPDECYRFSILQDQACRENAKELLGLIRLALAEYSYSRNQLDMDGLPLDDPDIQSRLLELVKLLVLKDATGMSKALVVKNPDAQVGDWIDLMTTKLLIPDADKDTRVSFDQVLALTNEFTLPFCQVKLILSLAADDHCSPEAADRQQTLLERFSNAMDNAIDAKNVSWIGMLSCLGAEITQHLKNRAQTRFLQLLPAPGNPAVTDGTLEHSFQMAESLLSVIDAIIRGGTMGRPPQLIAEMIDKFADLWEILATPNPATNPQVLNNWLPYLLNFITLHTQTFDTSKQSNETRARALMVCAGLMQELDALHGPGVDTRALSGRIFDLACLLADNVAEETRAMCARTLRDATSDGRIRYIFSFAAPPIESVMISTIDRVAVAAQGRRLVVPMGGLLGTPGALWGIDPPLPEKLTPFLYRRWEVLSEPTPAVGENDTALSLGLFEARKL